MARACAWGAVALAELLGLAFGGNVGVWCGFGRFSWALVLVLAVLAVVLAVLTPAMAPTSLNEGKGVSGRGRRCRRHVTWRQWWWWWCRRRRRRRRVVVVVVVLWWWLWSGVGVVGVVGVSLSSSSQLGLTVGIHPGGIHLGVRRRRRGRMVVVGVERGGGKKYVTWRRLNHGYPIWVLPNLSLLNIIIIIDSRQ